METVIIVVVVLFLLVVAVSVYATVKLVGAAKRGVDRTISQARRTVEDTTLRARSYTQPGPAAELAQLRLSLRSSMRATQDALHAAVAGDPTLKDSLDLFQKLSVHGHELDGELKHLESEPDRARLAERLGQLRERTERVTSAADSLRWAARDRAHRFQDDELDTLSAQIDIEAGALRHWTSGPASPGSPGSGAGAGTWPAPASGDPAAERSRPGRAGEIPPAGPRSSYPWQKENDPRPESAP